MRKLNISILGCGWLGMPLLESLVTAGHKVSGSSRDLDKLVAIQKAGAKAFLVDLPKEIPSEFVEGCEVLIVTLPPQGRRLGDKTTDDYVGKLIALHEYLDREQQPKVIFTSSTSVYGAAKKHVTERTPTRPVTYSGKAVDAAERVLRKLIPGMVILRLAGLIGPGRHPGRFYGGRERPVPEADAPVNLVHRDDVIGAILILLERYLFLEMDFSKADDSVQRLFEMKAEYLQPVFNVCAFAHPTKRDFYTAAAGPLKIAGFSPGGADGKVIDSSKLRALGWQPKWDDLSLTSL